MKISVRLSGMKDLEEIVTLINREHMQSKAVMKVRNENVKKWIDDRNSVVAVSEGKIVGHEALNIWPESKWAELRSAVVLKEFRGRGIAYKMTKMLVDRFAKKNPRTVFIAIKNKTEKGNGILVEMGFREIGLDEVPHELFAIRSHSERRAFMLETK